MLFVARVSEFREHAVDQCDLIADGIFVLVRGCLVGVQHQHELYHLY